MCTDRTGSVLGHGPGPEPDPKSAASALALAQAQGPALAKRLRPGPWPKPWPWPSALRQMLDSVLGTGHGSKRIQPGRRASVLQFVCN